MGNEKADILEIHVCPQCALHIHKTCVLLIIIFDIEDHCPLAAGIQCYSTAGDSQLQTSSSCIWLYCMSAAVRCSFVVRGTNGLHRSSEHRCRASKRVSAVSGQRGQRWCCCCCEQLSRTGSRLSHCRVPKLVVVVVDDVRRSRCSRRRRRRSRFLCGVVGVVGVSRRQRHRRRHRCSRSRARLVVFGGAVFRPAQMAGRCAEV